MGSRISIGQRVSGPINVYPSGAEIRLSDGSEGTILLVQLANPRPYLVERRRKVERQGKEVIVRDAITVTEGDFTVTRYPASALQVFGSPAWGSPAPVNSEREQAVPERISAVQKPSGIAGIARQFGIGQNGQDTGTFLLAAAVIGGGIWYLSRGRDD